MAPEDLLAAARRGDHELLGDRRDEVAAAVRGFAERGDAAAALELAGRTWRIWWSRREYQEGRAVANCALDAEGAEGTEGWRIRVLYADGLFAFRLGDQEASLQRNQQALALARAHADVRGECDALTGLARVALRDGRYDDVVVLTAEGRRCAQAAGDREAEASPLHLEAAGRRLQGAYADARALYLESLTLHLELDNRAAVAMEQHNLGWVELHLGHVDAAEARFQA